MFFIVLGLVLSKLAPLGSIQSAGFLCLYRSQVIDLHVGLANWHHYSELLLVGLLCLAESANCWQSGLLVGCFIHSFSLPKCEHGWGP